MECYIKIQLQNQSFALAGLSVGLLTTLFGLHSSSAIESTPLLMGIVSASIISGRVDKD
jgi:hypothetical protein